MDEMPGSLAFDLRRLVSNALNLLSDQLLLLALEARRAAQALGAIAAFGLAAGILLACTWLGLGAACALWLIEQGTRPSVAMLAASMLDLVGVFLFGIAIHRTSNALTFPATRRSLQGSKGDSEATV